MKTKLFGTVCLLSALTVVACGDDETGEGGSGGSTTTATGSTATKGSTGTMGTTKATTATGAAVCPLDPPTQATTCDEACSDLYDCGALTCNGATLCAFTGDAAEKTAFVGGCLESCANLMALIQLVDASDCAATVDTISGANAQFAMTCEDGIPTGNGGGGGN